ncbi:desampylase [Halorussus marinus]|uniref:desampylase n=1 Tax=Halorussus marinus TaxID=2505976 RepID=UPI00109267DC|nr:desampylase [Halorussus marinus]
MTLALPDDVREEILAHAREGAPEEVCGILAGRRDGDDAEVLARHPAANAAADPRTRYEIAAREQLELLEAIDEAGREVVGFYHSHPRGPAEPSATDAAEATWPGRSYVIAVPGESGGGEADDPTPSALRSWRWTGERFVAEDVRSTEASDPDA